MAASISSLTSDNVDEFSQSYDFISVNTTELPSLASRTPGVHGSMDNVKSWLGHFTANAVLAAHTITGAPDLREIPRLNLNLAARSLRLFQAPPGLLFQGMGDRIRASIADDPLIAHDSHMRIIGHIVMNGNEEERRMLNANIIRLVASPAPTGAENEPFDGTQMPPRPRIQPLRTYQNDHRTTYAQSQPQMQAYTMALFEYAQSRGEAVNVTYEQTDFGTPTCFCAELEIANETYQGEGISKTKAKHAAARQACETLNVVVNA